MIEKAGLSGGGEAGDARAGSIARGPGRWWRALTRLNAKRLGWRLIAATEKDLSEEAAIKATRRAIRAGASVEFSTTDFNEQALHRAAAANFASVCEELLGAGANLEAMDLNGCSPLLRAVESGSLESARVLLKAGANPNASRAYTMDNALHLAAGKDDLKMAQALIEFGARSVGDCRGNYPLHYALSEEMSRALIARAGGDPEAVNDEGETPWHRAKDPWRASPQERMHRELLLEAVARREAREIEAVAKGGGDASKLTGRARL